LLSAEIFLNLSADHEPVIFIEADKALHVILFLQIFYLFDFIFFLFE